MNLGNIIVLTGLILMAVGSFLGFIERSFSKKLHKLSISDTSGTLLIFIGIMVSGFEVPKLVLATVFLIVWNPLITHTIAKTFLARLRR